MERRKFTREFKLEAVCLIKDRGVSYVQASQDLSVHTSQLRDWVPARPLCLLRRRRESPVSRQGVPGRGALLAQDVAQPQPDRAMLDLG